MKARVSRRQTTPPCRSPDVPACGSGSSTCRGCPRRRQCERFAAPEQQSNPARKVSSRHRAGRAAGSGDHADAWREEIRCGCRARASPCGRARPKKRRSRMAVGGFVRDRPDGCRLRRAWCRPATHHPTHHAATHHHRHGAAIERHVELEGPPRSIRVGSGLAGRGGAGGSGAERAGAPAS